MAPWASAVVVSILPFAGHCLGHSSRREVQPDESQEKMFAQLKEYQEFFNQVREQVRIMPTDGIAKEGCTVDDLQMVGDYFLNPDGIYASYLNVDDIADAMHVMNISNDFVRPWAGRIAKKKSQDKHDSDELSHCIEHSGVFDKQLSLNNLGGFLDPIGQCAEKIIGVSNKCFQTAMSCSKTAFFPATSCVATCKKDHSKVTGITGMIPLMQIADHVMQGTGRDLNYIRSKVVIILQLIRTNTKKYRGCMQCMVPNIVDVANCLGGNLWQASTKDSLLNMIDFVAPKKLESLFTTPTMGPRKGNLVLRS